MLYYIVNKLDFRDLVIIINYCMDFFLLDSVNGK